VAGGADDRDRQQRPVHDRYAPHQPAHAHRHAREQRHRRAAGFNDSTAAAPLTKTWIAGAGATISAPQQYVAGNGAVYVFSGWSDGGSLSHEITVPATNVTYTATYALASVPARRRT
jgi:hypothetical protein